MKHGLPERTVMRRSYPVCLFLMMLLLCASCATQKKSSTRQKSRANHKAETPLDRIIQSARNYTGTPYAWGGTTRSGMDCSGLLYVAFQAGGIALPRTSGEQSKVGRQVNLYSLQPGDLVFFAAKKGRNKITHVGMVTQVLGKHDVQFIHASTKLGVVENNIHSDYYRRIFVKARRPF